MVVDLTQLENSMNPIVRSALVLATGTVLAVGCAPARPDLPPNILGQAELAILTSSDDGYGWDIELLDISGNVIDRIDANLPEAVSLTHQGDGVFLVSDGSDILRVTPDGNSERFNQEPMPSVVYRMNITDDDEVTIAEEYDVTKLDEEGNLLEHTVVPGNEFCWMDAAPGTVSGGGDALLDVFGPTLATWNEDDDSFDIVAANFGEGASVLGRDNLGNYFAGNTWDSELTRVSPSGQSARLSSLADLGLDIYGISAIEPAGASDVLVLYAGESGSGIVRVDTAGNAQPLVEGPGKIWLDMVTY